LGVIRPYFQGISQGEDYLSPYIHFKGVDEVDFVCENLKNFGEEIR